MSVTSDMAALYRAEVMHQRFSTACYRFRYRVFSLLFDIDAIDGVAASTALFSRNRFNVISFYDADHLPHGTRDLRGWAEQVLEEAGIDGKHLKIRLLCMPRVFGWGFNPLSLWFCETPEGEPAAVIAEVRNTFGERHCYLLKSDVTDAGWPLRQRHLKDFHVSPFIDMDAAYEFRLSRPGDKLCVVIREFQKNRLMLVATQTGRRRPFRSSELLREVLRVPVQTLKVLSAIHWQALKIWLKGARFHRKPAPPLDEVS